jgi:hypothetical protein
VTAPTDVERADALRGLLGVPNGRGAGFFKLDLGGPMLELFTVDDDGSAPGCPRLSLLSHGIAAPLPGMDDSVFQIWRARIFREGSPLFAEMIWTPIRGYLYSIRAGRVAESKQWKKAQADRAIKDLMRLQALEGAQRGRPLGKWQLSGLTEKQMVADYQALASEGDRPTQERMAEEYFVETSTFKRWLKDQDIPWPPR